MHRTRKKTRLSMCESCDEPDTSEMIKCKDCDKKSHYSCAGLGEEFENLVWLCHACASVNKNRNPKQIQGETTFYFNN